VQALPGHAWKRLLRIYAIGALLVTGQPLRAIYAVALMVSVVVLYPVAVLLDMRYEAQQRPAYLILARAVSAVGLLCPWPAFLFWIDTTNAVCRRASTCAPCLCSSLIMGVLMLMSHSLAMLRFWPWEHV
jgi:hypothetical protein